MQYRIEFHNIYCEFANGTHELAEKLAEFINDDVFDIRRITGKNSSESVIDIYGKFAGKGCTGTGSHP